MGIVVAMWWFGRAVRKGQQPPWMVPDGVMGADRAAAACRHCTSSISAAGQMGGRAMTSPTWRADLSATDDAATYGVVDEVARRVWLSGGRVLAVRRDGVPGRNSVAAILRNPL